METDKRIHHHHPRILFCNVVCVTISKQLRMIIPYTRFHCHLHFWHDIPPDWFTELLSWMHFQDDYDTLPKYSAWTAPSFIPSHPVQLQYLQITSIMAAFLLHSDHLLHQKVNFWWSGLSLTLLFILMNELHSKYSIYAGFSFPRLINNSWKTTEGNTPYNILRHLRGPLTFSLPSPPLHLSIIGLYVTLSPWPSKKWI